MGARQIEELEVGDMVRGYDIQGSRPVYVAVRAVHRARAAEILLINDQLRVTPEHPVFVNGEWQRAGRIAVGDTLLDRQGEPHRVARIERINGVIDVVNLTVKAPNNFFVNGLLVHNKSRGYSPSLDDPWYGLPGVPPP